MALLLLTLLPTSFACGSGPTAPSPTIDGTWQGTAESVEDGPGVLTVTLSHSGLDVSGEFFLSQSGLVSTGKLTGTLTKSGVLTTMRYTVSYKYGPFDCSGSFSGTATVTPRSLDGPFGGSNCVHAFSGVLHATKTN
jgi:hypothetical protein